MSEVTKPLILDETGKSISSNVETLGETMAEFASAAKEFFNSQEQKTTKYPIFDTEKGEYTNESIAAWLESENDGIIYGVEQSLTAVQTCTKILGNMGIHNPTPSTLANVGTDPYADRGPFRYYRCNATVDDTGTYHVTGIDRFGGFVNDGTKDVFQLTPIRYERRTILKDSVQLLNCDTPRPGLAREQRSWNAATGRPLPFMLRAVYPMSIDGSGKPWSITGAKIANRSVSQSSLSATMAKKGEYYSGLTMADDAYLYDMYLLKYANKSSQNNFAGCSNYDVQASPTVEETGVNRVILANSDADKFDIGSACMFGNQSTSTKDRGQAPCYNIFDGLKIVGKQAIDESNTALIFETSTTFDTKTTYLLSTAPWRTGACDGIVYDGSPTNNTNGHEPFVLQGIEVSHGCYEIAHDAMASSTGDGWSLHVAKTTDKVASSLTDDYVKVYSFPKVTEGWKYPLWAACYGSAYVAVDFSGSSTTGIGDGIYIQAATISGTREVLLRGPLLIGSLAGLRCVSLANWLGVAWWDIASRVSVNGRFWVNFD